MISVSFSKAPSEVRNFIVDFSASLSSVEQLISVSAATFTPSDVALIVTSSVTAGGKSITLAVSGGTANKSYVITFTATSSLAQVIQRSVGLSVGSTLELPIDSNESIPRLTGLLQAGDSVQGNVVLNFPAGSALSGGQLNWELLNNSGVVYSSGFGSYTLATSVNGSVLLNGTAIVGTPSNLQPSDGSVSYQLRWIFIHNTILQPVYAFEAVTVLSKYETSHGIEDVIELMGTVATINCVLEKAYDSVVLEIYDRMDVVVVGPVNLKPTETLVSGGVLYTAQVNTTSFSVDLVPRTVAVKYSDGHTNAPINRTFGRLYVVTPTTLAACEDLRTFINRTNTTIVGSPDMVFTTSALLTFLRMGKDYFNMLHHMTSFTMSRASGGIRDGWLMCTSIRALRSQFMSEGEQAFDYQGQAISLTVDRTQFYDSLAGNLEGQLEMYKNFKAQLTKRGITSGDGDLDNTSGQRGNIAAVGVNSTPVSSFGAAGYRRRQSFF